MNANSLYEVYNARQSEIADLTDRQLQVVQSLDVDRFYKPGSKPAEQLGELSTRLKTAGFRVLVMGEFSSGKSTFVNSLLGARILPDSVLPTTAVITEIRYADDSEKRITLYPKPGKWKDGDRPFDIGLHEFQRYTSIQHRDGSADPSPFMRAEVFWPLAFCRDKVDLVDSPGLNDPDNHDEITLTYAPSADAIIYCMSCERAYTKLDAVTINTLCNQGYTSLLFVLTKFDRVEESAMMKGSDEAQEFRSVMLDKLKQKTDLGTDGIFFVDSLHGLLARIKNNPELLAGSGIPDVERRMASYIVQQKGKAKLMKAIYSIRASNSLASQTLDERLALSTTSLHNLERKYDEAKLPLERLARRGELICAQVDLGLRDTVRDVEDVTRAFLMTCPGRVPSWLEDYKPEAELSLNPLKIKASVGAVAGDFINQVKLRMKEDGAIWGKQVLTPLITRSVQSVFSKLDHHASEYNAQLEQIRVNLILDGTSDGETIANLQEPSTASRLSSIIYGIVTLNPAAASGAVFGWQGLFRSLGVQFVILAIAGLFTPLGPFVVIAGLIAGALGGAGWTALRLMNTIREKVLANTQAALRNPEQQAKLVKAVVAGVQKELFAISEDVKGAFQADLARLKGEVEAAIQQKKKDASGIQLERERLDSMRRENALITDRIVAVAMEAGVLEARHHLPAR